MKHFHWLRQLNYSRMQPEHRTRPRNDQTSLRYPFEHTCTCGVKTAMARDGRIRPHRVRARLQLKHAPGLNDEDRAIITACVRGNSGSVVA